MPDETNTLVEQVQTSQQQVPAGFVEQARFNGLVQKVEQLTLANRALEGQLATKTSEIEQLRTQLVVKDTEKGAAVTERDGKLAELVQTKATLESEIAVLRGLKLKIETVKKMGRPDLLRVIDTIPNLTDAAALETVFKEMADYGDLMVKNREQQLMAGITPGMTAAQATVSADPSSEDAWQKKINELPLGSAERGKAFDSYWAWLSKNHS